MVIWPPRQAAHWKWRELPILMQSLCGGRYNDFRVCGKESMCWRRCQNGRGLNGEPEGRIIVQRAKEGRGGRERV